MEKRFADAGPPIYYFDVVRDIRGCGVSGVQVDVFVAGTAKRLASTRTTYDGMYVLDLSGRLADNPLVDICYSGYDFPLMVKSALRLLADQYAVNYFEPHLPTTVGLLESEMTASLNAIVRTILS